MASTEIIARALIEKDGKVLLCHGKGKDNWFFPGGHIEEGESAPEALMRELDEELGATGSVHQFLGASENKFEIDGKTIHEINLIFEVVLDDTDTYQSKEDHLEFDWFTYSEMEQMTVFPVSLTNTILKLPAKNKTIWASDGFL